MTAAFFTREQLADIVTKSIGKSGSRAKLLSDPTDLPKAEGVDVPAGTAPHVVEDAADRRKILLPIPDEGQMVDEDLPGLPAGAFTAREVQIFVTSDPRYEAMRNYYKNAPGRKY